MPWGPYFNEASVHSNIFPLTILLHYLSQYITGQVVQKVVLLLIIASAITGAYQLIRAITRHQSAYILYPAALLYLFNPFFYTRFIEGQWLVLCGYALLPWAVRSIYIFVKDPRWAKAWPVAAWTIAIALTSIHTIGIVALAGLGLLMYSGREQWRAKLKWLLVIAGLWLAANATWIVPFVLGQSPNAQAVAGFSDSQMQAFATRGTVAGSVPLSAALLTGFWADNQNRYILPSSLPIWWIGVAILFSVIILGIILTIKRKDRLGITFLSLGIIAWLLGMGIAWPPSALITDAIIKLVPVYNGYREPQKWLMLLALVYVYFLAIGAARLFAYVAATFKSSIPRYALATLLLIAPFLYTPTLAWGAAGQLKSVDYPKGWYDAKTYLNAHADDEAQVLVVPWHVYLPLSWVGRVVANPAPYFFDQTMVTSDQVELAGVPPQNSTDTQAYVSNYIIPNLTVLTNAGSKLKAHGISYVLLEKESDYARYQPFLSRQTDLQRVYENANISIYKVMSNDD